jgi:hypothetical protein
MEVRLHRQDGNGRTIYVTFPSKLRREHWVKLPYFKLGPEAKLYLRDVGLGEQESMFDRFEIVARAMGTSAGDERW